MAAEVVDFTKHPDLLAKILDLADDAIISVDETQRILMFNQGAERIFGFSAAEVVGRPLEILLPERLAELHRRHIHAFITSSQSARRMGERSEILGRRKDGVEFAAEASISKVVLDGQMRMTVILRDVSRRVAADEKMKLALREKEALLREIHHRVKNNLQVVSSLLGLQSRGVSDEQTRTMLEESQNRVQSMAMLHESLYRSSNLSEIDFPEYVRQLASHLFHSYGVRPERIRLRTNLDKLNLGLDAAVPCGLIINELVSNSLKHAFPGGGEGEIRIELLEIPEGMVKLVVADNGAGFDTSISTSKTLGLRLVRMLAEQLGAKVEMQSGAGTETQLTFSVG